MDLRSIINSLRRESDALGEIILAMERLLEARQSTENSVAAKRRGRPPGSRNRIPEPVEINGKRPRSPDVH